MTNNKPALALATFLAAATPACEEFLVPDNNEASQEDTITALREEIATLKKENTELKGSEDFCIGEIRRLNTEVESSESAILFKKKAEVEETMERIRGLDRVLDNL